MPVSRLLPTPEAARADRAGARPRATASCCRSPASHEREERFPREVFRTLGKAGILGLPYPEEQGGGGQPLRGVAAGARGARRPLGVGRRRRLGARADLLPARRVRHAGAAGALAARDARRRAARRLLPVRGRRRQRPGRDAHPRGADGDGYVARRRQGLGHPRRPRRLLHLDGAHLRQRPRRHQLLPRPGRRRRPDGRPARGQDGPDRQRHRDDALRRRARRRRPAASAPRARACRSRSPRWTPAGSASPRSPPDWRRRALDARRRLRQGAPDVRQGDHRPPGARASCSPTCRPRSRPPAPPTSTRPAARTSACRTPRRPASPSSSPPTRP